MKLAIFGKSLDPKDLATIANLFTLLSGKGMSYCIEEKYLNLRSESRLPGSSTNILKLLAMTNQLAVKGWILCYPLVGMALCWKRSLI